MSAPRRLGISLRLRRFFQRPRARNPTISRTSSTPRASTSVRSRSILTCTGLRRMGLVPLGEAGGKALGEALAEFAPQQAGGCAGGLLDGGGEIDELADVFGHVARGVGVELGVFF